MRTDFQTCKKGKHPESGQNGTAVRIFVFFSLNVDMLLSFMWLKVRLNSGFHGSLCFRTPRKFAAETELIRISSDGPQIGVAVGMSEGQHQS